MARGAHRVERRRGARALLVDEPQGRIYERAIGTDTFEGNDATRWGTENEPNALVARIDWMANQTGVSSSIGHSKNRV